MNSTKMEEAPLRQVIVQKSWYVPHSAPEEFIVPVLRREIESCIAGHATPVIGKGKALDMGCGGQPFREMLKQAGYSYCSADVNAQGVEVDFQCAADEPLPEGLLRRGPFDFVLCTEVLEHVADWRMAFSNISRLLAPSGRALITAPHFYQLHEEPYDFWRPTLHSIVYYGERAGLRPIYRRAAGDGWDVIGTALANCQFLARSRRLADRAAARGMRAASRFLFRTLVRRALQRRVRVEGPLYISNIVVLEKNG